MAFCYGGRGASVIPPQTGIGLKSGAMQAGATIGNTTRYLISMIDIAHIYHFRSLDPLLATGGQPLEEELRALAAAGFKLVINLALPTSDNTLPNEAEIVRGLNMEYLAIPVVWEAPRPEDFARFCAVMDANTQRRRFVHCAANYRVASFIYLYRVMRLGWSPERAQKDLYAIWQPDATWRRFIVGMTKA